MYLEQVLPALREGHAIQRTGQPIKWAYLKRSDNGAFHWYGYGDDPTRGSPMSLDHTHLLADDWLIVDEAEAIARKPAPTHACPRRGESFRHAPGEALVDHWGERDGKRVCSFCGSLNPDDFMAHLEAGDVELGPTDKNYKVYVDGAGVRNGKFYFQHLSEDQCRRFIELLNEKKLKIGYPGNFYRMPFFCQPVDK